jgi:hypothetical protein
MQESVEECWMTEKENQFVNFGFVTQKRSNLIKKKIAA